MKINNFIKSTIFKSGFTLAEVLITLGIIGIVAAMTIPTLQANYQKQEYVTKLKKAYTEFNQALTQMSADMGCPGDLKCTGLFPAAATQEEDITATQNFGEEIVKYFKVAKICNPSETGCWPTPTYRNYNKSNEITSGESSSSYKFLTLNGMIYNLAVDNCSKNRSLTGIGSLAQSCGHMFVDINGFKPPNAFGRDIFWFWITNGKGPLLYPVGSSDEAYESGNSAYWKGASGGCTPSKPDGARCSGRIMDESWQMNY